MNRGQQPGWSSRRHRLYIAKTDWVDAEQERQYDLSPVSALTKSSQLKSPSCYSVDPWEVDDGDDDDEDEHDEELPRPAPVKPGSTAPRQQPLPSDNGGSPSTDESVESGYVK
jgi:hypothetical protein